MYPDRTVEYHIVCKYSKRQAQANTVDPDQTPQKAASDVDLNCLHEVQIFYFKYLDSQARSKSIDLIRCNRMRRPNWAYTVCKKYMYMIFFSKYLDRQTLANSEDPDQ